MNDIVPQNTETLVNRSALRQLLLAQRHCMSITDKQTREHGLLDQLVKALNQYPKAIVAIYMPHLGEPNILALATSLSNPLCLPVVMGKQLPLQFASWQAGDAMVNDRYGIATPANRAWVTPEVLLIPCVGYTHQALRLGYGGGYYDRTLAAVRSTGGRAVALGVAWKQAECAFQANEYDIPMDKMILA